MFGIGCIIAENSNVEYEDMRIFDFVLKMRIKT